MRSEISYFTLLVLLLFTALPAAESLHAPQFVSTHALVPAPLPVQQIASSHAQFSPALPAQQIASSRAQFLPALPVQQTVQVQLAGFKQVPPVRSPGSGTLMVILRADTLFVEGEFQDLGGQYRSAGIHFGSEQESGNRLFGLTVDPGDDFRSGQISRSENVFVLRPAILQSLSDGNLYVNIGSDEHPGGEIRGQIPAILPEGGSVGAGPR